MSRAFKKYFHNNFLIKTRINYVKTLTFNVNTIRLKFEIILNTEYN